MIDRTTIVTGPAIVTYNSQTFHTKDNIALTLKLNTFEINSSIFSKVDERLDDVLVEVSFTPVGKPEAFTTLWPYQNPTADTSIFGATDKDLVIWTYAGKQITLKNAAVTKMPDIILSSTKTIIGSMTFSAIGQNNLAWTDAAKRSTIADAAFSDSSFAPADIVTQGYAVAWGSSSPWDSIATEDGVVISSSVKTKPIKTDTDGIVDMIMDSVDVTAKFVPVGVSETQLIALLKMQGASVLRGASLATINTGAFSAIGSGFAVRFASAFPRATPMTFDRSKNRAGEVEFVAARTFSSGVPQDLFAVAAS